MYSKRKTQELEEIGDFNEEMMFMSVSFEEESGKCFRIFKLVRVLKMKW